MSDIKNLLEELKAYRNDMVARNYPFQRISDIITKWEMKKITTKDFLEEAQKTNKELEESYQESKRQTEERKQREWLKGYRKWKEDK
jgi:DNA repair exonuclease SbcCD ATPase subunit